MDIYAIVTDKIINLLEQGVVPWRRPWTATGLLALYTAVIVGVGMLLFQRRDA